MKNSFFVASERDLKLVYVEDGTVKGDRFKLRIVFSSPVLDKNGFVVDFILINDILDSLEEIVSSKKANDLLEQGFSFPAFLGFIKDFVEKRLKSEHIVITEVSLTNGEEGYIGRFDS